MPRAGVRVDGETVVVEYPKGATDAQITALARQQKSVGSRAKPAAAAPVSGGPDVVGRATSWMTREPPAGSRTMFGETDMPGRIVRAAGDLFLPSSVPEAARYAATLPIGGGLVTGPLMRTAAGAAAGGLAKYAQGGDPSEAAEEARSEGFSQLAGEVLPGALRFGLTQRAGKRLLGERAAEIEQRDIQRGKETALREGKIAHDTALNKAVSELEKEDYTAKIAGRRKTEAAGIREARTQHQERLAAATRQQAEAEAARKAQHEAAVASATERHAADVRAYEKDGARIIAEGFKQQVPAFRDFPSTEAGLLNMVSGEGPQRMSARFDTALKDVVALGRGVGVEIPLKDAQALGVRTMKVVEVERGRPMATVDAGQLAEKATGFWKKDHGVYHRAFGALDKADIGDPASRAEYRAGRALLTFAESSQMLKGQKFNPDAARAAFDRVKKLDTLRKRGQGDMFTGPVAEAVNRPGPELRLPGEGAPIPEPVRPAFRRPAPPPEVTPPARRAIVNPPELAPLPPLSTTPEGVTMTTLPKFSFWEGAAIGEIPFILGALATGQHPSYGLGAVGTLAGAAGGLAAKALSGRPVVTAAPLPRGAHAATQLLPGSLAQEARRLMGGEPIKMDLTNVAPSSGKRPMPEETARALRILGSGAEAGE